MNGKLLTAGAAMGFISAGLIYYDRKKNVEKTFRDSDLYKDVFRIVSAHAATKHFLGEPIEDHKIKFISKHKGSDFITERVQIYVKGNKNKGSIHFWVRVPLQNQDNTQLYRVELAADNLKNRVLIMKGGNVVDSTNKSTPEPPKNDSEQTK